LDSHKDGEEDPSISLALKFFLSTPMEGSERLVHTAKFVSFVPGRDELVIAFTSVSFVLHYRACIFPHSVP